MKSLKRIGIILLCLLLVLLAITGIYVAYVFTAYYRLEDKLPLEVLSGEGTEPLTAGERYRVLSYNVGFGAYNEEFSFFMDGGKDSRAESPEVVYENIGGAMQSVKAVNPDLVLIQEVDEDGDRSYHIDQRQLVKDALPDFDSVYAQNWDCPYLFWPPTRPHGANKAGQLTLSRFPIASALRRSLPIDPGLMKIVDLDRCYTVNRIPAEDGRELVLYNFHLSAYTADTAIADNQLKMLFADMEEEIDAGNWVIAGGDFNKDLLGNSPEVFRVTAIDSNWAQPFPKELLPDNIRLIAPFDPELPVASCRNADRPYGPGDLVLTVDGFLISDNVELLESKVVDEAFQWSDHNPVYLDFKLN